MVIADRQAAYVGSGEIRENSFLTNGEAGVLTVSESDVSYCREFFDIFWQEAAIVNDVINGPNSH